MPLTYDAGTIDLVVGDVVRVPLGTREELAYVITAPAQRDPGRALRRISQRLDVPRAFDETGLALARFIANEYLCTLGDAMTAVVLAAALPKTVTLLEPIVERHDVVAAGAAPRRLVELIWNDFRGGFSVERLLRHPEARRAGDRAQLLRALEALVRRKALRRVRRFDDPRMSDYRIRVLEPGDASPRGSKASALVSFVRERSGIPRADAILAGFSAAVIARAIASGALRENYVTPSRERLRAIAPPAFEATAEQRAAIDRLRDRLKRRAFDEVVLHGITGSGKTFVYIETIAHVLREGGRAIVLVPEISLTPQTARRFEEAFGARVAVLHSALSDRERYDAWSACARGEIEVIVGARSAIFAPLPDVRIAIVDEFHEATYRQEQSPRYHAVTVARERMRLGGGLLVLGSATPALEAYARTRSGEIDAIALRERATGQALPHVQVVDMAEEFERGNRRIFSAALTQAIGERLERGEKTVLFVNRRGSAGFLLCRACGLVPECARCSVSLTVHRDDALLRCHYCDYQRRLAVRCERCGSDAVRELAAGTQRVAQEVERLFSDARVVRMDSDTTTRIGAHARLLDEFAQHGDILVGTQMVAKGLDFADVTLVGAVAADVGLHAPDFRAAERTFQLITQVCGRSGRARRGAAIVQTYSPRHHAIVCAAAHDYERFAEIELAARAASRFPPACELLYLGVISRARNVALSTAERYARVLADRDGVTVLGPAPYPIARVNDEWRFRIALKGKRLADLQSAVRDEILPLARADRSARLVIVVSP